MLWWGRVTLAGAALLRAALLPDPLCRRTWPDAPQLPRVVVVFLLKEGHDGARHLGFRAGLDLGVQYSWLFQQLEGPLAQLVDHRTFNPWVVGSIPTGPTLQIPRNHTVPGDFLWAGFWADSPRCIRFSSAKPWRTVGVRLLMS